ncbi:hypothetical protein H8N03_16345 [Ramlibacter sp. USB13]|uniref:DUF4870 domain-containing protein n=1 Tax=Ramlibacter cellulosilyticus TaxID=2764187 RepID=A0A923MUP6_9BURK|nr:hypothetical protein [Ramlibacter cellulosilyticus]MBC5784519.1 hypothetical protein [Ramlibacter cellulosilyticus]
MAETDYVTLEDDNGNPGRRTVMHVLYGMHTVAPFTLWSLSLIALVVHYVKRADETDARYVAHHSYMIRTVWWTLLWLLITSPLWLLFVFPGAIAYTLIGAWYLYRCLRGWLRFNDNRYPD